MSKYVHSYMCWYIIIFRVINILKLVSQLLKGFENGAQKLTWRVGKLVHSRLD